MKSVLFILILLACIAYGKKHKTLSPLLIESDDDGNDQAEEHHKIEIPTTKVASDKQKEISAADDNRPDFPLDTDPISPFYMNMIRNDKRNKAYLDAIKNIGIKTFEDVVLEIGTGQGLMAMKISNMTKPKVLITCEKSVNMYNAAKQIIKHNGFDKDITLINKYSYNLKVGSDLPEKADVLITDMMGNALIDDGLLMVIADAKERLLKDEAKIIPMAAKMIVQLIQSSFGFETHGSKRKKGTPADYMIEGLDFSHYNDHRWRNQFSYKSKDNPHKNMSDPIVPFQFNFMDKDFKNALDQDDSFILEATNTGIVNAVLMWWQVELWEGIFLSNMDHGSHWGQYIMQLGVDMPVSKGDMLEIRTAHNATHQMYNVKHTKNAVVLSGM